MTARNPPTDATEFSGVVRESGEIGVRDQVLVLPSVICSHMVADRIADRVPEAVSTPHDHGCAQIGADNEQTKRTFLSLAQNPNVAGTLVVGLGCEHVQSDEVEAELLDLGVPVREVAIQDAGGTEECIEVGVDAVEELTAGRATSQTPATLGDLTVGVIVSDLDDSTVETAAPVVGELVHQVAAAGGRVVAAGSERLTAHHEDARAITTGDAQGSLEELFERHRDQPARAKRVARQAANLDFDVATTEWGNLDIGEVLNYGERTSLDSGLAVVDAPSRFEEAATALAAAGAQLVVHVTADGITSGHPLVPTVKVSGDEATVEALPDDIDVDATDASAEDLRERVLEVADGESSCAERHGLTEFAITRVGPSM